MAVPARAVLVAVLVVAVVAGGAPLALTSAASAGTPSLAPSLGPSLPTSHPANLTTHPTSNLSIPLPEPGAGNPQDTLDPGAVFQPSLRLEPANYTSSDYGAIVHLPPMAVILTEEVSGQLRINVNSFNITLTGAGWVEPPTGAFPQYTVATLISLDDTSNALFTTQLVSVTSTLAWPSIQLAFEWSYNLTEPTGGGTIWSGWSENQTLVPDQIATLVRTSPTTLSPGGRFMACLTGPIEGRTFSLHAETVSPVDDFVRVNITVPLDALLPYCWNETIPTWVPPQGLIAHIWSYERFNTSSPQTFLLYVIPLSLVAPSTSTPLRLLGVGVPVWLYFTTIGIVTAGVVLVAYLIVTRWPKRRPPTVQPWGGPAGGAGGTPPAPPGGETGGGAAGGGETAPTLPRRT